MKRLMIALALAASCSVPPLVANTNTGGIDEDHLNRCYRLFEAGPYRDSCLKQFPTGDPYIFNDDPVPVPAKAKPISELGHSSVL